MIHAPERNGTVRRVMRLPQLRPSPATLARAAGVVGLAAFALYFVTAGASAHDAHAYWAADLADPYTSGVNEEDAYLYSPAFLHALTPLRLLPWEAFWIAWVALNLAVLGWTVGPLVGVLLLLPGPYSPVFVNMWYGNIGVLMAAALVLAFRWPGAWSFLVLTKITPGVGIAWFIARRQWRYVAVAAGTTAAIAALSFALAPEAWLSWPAHLSGTSPEIFPLPPLWLRLAAATAVAAVGGYFSARWTVVVAAVLAQPVFWFTGFTMFIAWLGLVRHRQSIRAAESQLTNGRDVSS